jgi:hypothetical protein
VARGMDPNNPDHWVITNMLCYLNLTLFL